jgi:hypothetical protein
MLDLIVRNASLADGRRGIDVGVEAGRISAVEPHLQAAAGQTIDAEGLLLAAPFVDSHFHMDATLSVGLPRRNRSGTLLEGIALWGELKPSLTQEAIVERALGVARFQQAGEPVQRENLPRVADATEVGSHREGAKCRRKRQPCLLEANGHLTSENGPGGRAKDSDALRFVGFQQFPVDSDHIIDGGRERILRRQPVIH